MKPEISELFDLIDEHDDNLCRPSTCRYMIAAKKQIQEISATLNPQISEPWASMSRDEILGEIGQYD